MEMVFEHFVLKLGRCSARLAGVEDRSSLEVVMGLLVFAEMRVFIRKIIKQGAALLGLRDFICTN